MVGVFINTALKVRPVVRGFYISVRTFSTNLCRHLVLTFFLVLHNCTLILSKIYAQLSIETFQMGIETFQMGIVMLLSNTPTFQFSIRTVQNHLATLRSSYPILSFYFPILQIIFLQIFNTSYAAFLMVFESIYTKGYFFNIISQLNF